MGCTIEQTCGSKLLFSEHHMCTNISTSLIMYTRWLKKTGTFEFIGFLKKIKRFFIFNTY